MSSIDKGRLIAGPESGTWAEVLEKHKVEYFDYCPNADVSIWFRLLDKWLPAFFIAIALIFAIGVPTGTLHPALIFLAKTFLVPLKPYLNMHPNASFSGLINTLSTISQPIFFVLGLFMAKMVLEQKHLPNLLIVGKSGIDLMLKRGSISGSSGTYWTSLNFVPWTDITKVQLVRPKKKRSNLDYVIALTRKNGKPLNIRYGDILTPWHRMQFLEALNTYLPKDIGCDELKEVFGSPTIRQSYTEIWLRELTAAPKRDKLTPLAPGAQLQDGAYEVVEKLGMGGQGTVYLAHSHRLPGETNMVALKEFMLPVFPDPKVRMKAAERFQIEAEMLARLQHPQIVKFHDLFIEDHRAYLVMERAEGENLKSLVQKSGPLPEREVARLAWQMCGILKFLHSNDPPITHRDFTPDNLILSSDGMLKLIDFSVARQIESNVTGSVVGKPNFMAPEQFRGKPIPQSDLYSLGATMFFLLTGKEPEAIQSSILGESFTRTMNELVAKATSIEVENRFESASEFAFLLETYLAENIDQTEKLDGAVIQLEPETRAEPR